MLGFGIGITMQRGSSATAATAPEYVEPIDDDPIEPPVGEPEPPADTPIDPETEEPEPGFDSDYVAPDRIEITDSKQTVIRTETDPGTWGNAYVASALTGPEYWEIEVAAQTPNGATLAVGVSTLAMPLNGIPGALPGTIAYWSDGSVYQNDALIATLDTYGRRDTIGVAYGDDGSVIFYKNCVAQNSGDSVGTVAGTVYPFAALYSANTRTAFKFSSGKFGCALPDDYYPIGQTPEPEEPIGDADFASVVLLAGFDGANGATSYTEESSAARAVSFANQAKISTAQSKFGTGSLELDGTSDYVSVGDSPDWDFGTAPFTLEGWFRFRTTPTNALLMMQWSGSFRFWFTGGELFVRNSAFADTNKYAWAPATDTWHHIAFDRDASNVARIYANGVMVTKNTSYTHNFTGSSAAFTIGSLITAGVSGHDIDGYVDEIRVTKGVARYGSDAGFVVPTAAFPRSTVTP